MAFKIDTDYTTWNIDDYKTEGFETLLEAALPVRKGYLESEKLQHLGRILCHQIRVTTHDEDTSILYQKLMQEMV